MTGGSKNIAIRADAAYWIGSGHVARCAALADTLRQSGARVHFICRELPGNYCRWLEEQGYRVHRLRAAPGSLPTGLHEPPAHIAWLGVPLPVEIEECKAILEQHGPFDWLIVDHYALDQTWEQAMASLACKLMVIDDLADRPHYCDLLLDQNLQSATDRYHRLVPDGCRCLLGPAFALLRQEFTEQRKAISPRSGNLHSLLVFMGGNDAENVTSTVLVALLADPPPISDLEVNVVIGEGNPHRQEIAERCAKLPNGRLHVQTPEMASLMSRADLMLGTAGTTSWERCCLGLPTITVSAAANQRENGRLTAASRVAQHLGDSGSVSPTHLASAIKGLARHPGLLRKMSARAFKLVDGLGAWRAIAVMQATDLVLRKMRPDDCEMAWRWRNAPSTRKNAFNPNPIGFEEHREWFTRTLSNENRHLLLGSMGNKGVGVLRFDSQPDGWEISIYLDPELHGLGLGSCLIAAGITWLNDHTVAPVSVFARIRPENHNSAAAFLKAGFISETASVLRWPSATASPSV